MTSFHTEVCSTATVWFCLTPSFSLYNRESERNRSSGPGRGGCCMRCVVWQKQNGKTWERREWFCGCRFVCLRLSVWVTWHCLQLLRLPLLILLLVVFLLQGQLVTHIKRLTHCPHNPHGLRLWEGVGWRHQEDGVCVCVEVLREQQQEANEGGCTNESTQSGRKWGPRGVAQEEKRIQSERVYEHCAQVTREKMKNASRRRKGNVGAKQEVKADGNRGRRKKTN